MEQQRISKEKQRDARLKNHLRGSSSLKYLRGDIERVPSRVLEPKLPLTIVKFLKEVE
jgi:hypothetical protein